MGRLALTLWFTVTTLLGSGVCCCSFASSPHAAPTASAVGLPAPTGNRAKACCQREAPPCGEPGKQIPEPGRPAKCPCDHGKQVQTLSPGGQTHADLVAQLKWIDGPVVGLLAPFAFDPSPTTSASADTSPPGPKLAGRDLLAAYSLLRC